MMMRLLMDDEGVIDRGDWWLGLALIGSLHALAAALAVEWLPPAPARGLTTFLAIAALVPFYNINAKRLRATGRPSLGALLAVAPPALMTLAQLYIGWRPLDMALGVVTLGAMIWAVVDLGVVDHRPTIDRSRLRP